MALAQTPNLDSDSADSQATYQVTSEDLPLHCPTSEMELWNSHPRVFLPIEKTGSAKCPYCGTDFVLKKTD